MKSCKIATAALAAVAMLGTSSAFAAAPAASKLSLTSAQSLRADGVDQRRANRLAPGRGRLSACTTDPSKCNINLDKFGISSGPGKFGNFLSNPLVITGIVATAIAVPVALSNSNPSSP